MCDWNKGHLHFVFWLQLCFIGIPVLIPLTELCLQHHHWDVKLVSSLLGFKLLIFRGTSSHVPLGLENSDLSHKKDKTWRPLSAEGNSRVDPAGNPNEAVFFVLVFTARTPCPQWRLPLETQEMLTSGAPCWRPWQMPRWRRRSEIRTETQGECWFVS